MSRSIEHDYYKVLELPQNANEQDIKRAFRRLAMKYHPDKNTALEAEEKFKEINEAYEILSSPEKRWLYDFYWAENNTYYQNPFENFNSYDASSNTNEVEETEYDSTFNSGDIDIVIPTKGGNFFKRLFSVIASLGIFFLIIYFAFLRA